ncbi:MAG TPA: hypothetical protein VNF68_10430 [Candidatus Baltobacteraceae bacterium]|nr:hypothetical protein [Candidatus Baltobacteraceae bacterium]
MTDKRGRLIPLVTNGEWSVSSASGHGIDGFILSVFRVVSTKLKRDRFCAAYGDAHGKIFQTREALDRFALERGYLQVHYRKQRCDGRFGGPACGRIHSYLLTCERTPKYGTIRKDGR